MAEKALGFNEDEFDQSRLQRQYVAKCKVRGCNKQSNGVCDHDLQELLESNPIVHELFTLLVKLVSAAVAPVTNRKGEYLRLQAHLLTNSMHPSHHDAMREDLMHMITVVVSWCEDGGRRWWNLLDTVTGERINLPNAADGKLTMLAFSTFFNLRWKHGVYPYEKETAEAEHSYTAVPARKAQHMRLVEEQKPHLPTNGKKRWSLQMHFRLLAGMGWPDFVACFAGAAAEI